jgi:hypothetical protein
VDLLFMDAVQVPYEPDAIPRGNATLPATENATREGKCASRVLGQEWV